MNRVALPYTTTTSGLSVFDRDNQYRPLQWDEASNTIEWLDREDNGLLLTILENMPSMEKEFNEPIINWTEDTRTEVATTLTVALTAGGTTATIADSYVAVINTYLTFPVDGEIIKVSAVDRSAGTWTIERGVNGTAARAKAIGDNVIAMGANMAELDDPNGGVGRLPGTAQHNFISLVSKSLKVGTMQNSSGVLDGWGQVPKAAIDTVLDTRREVGYALLFQARATYATTDAGQMYISQGALHYNRDGFLDLGTQANNVTWQILNDYLEGLFDSDASSQEKTLLAGQNLYRTGLKMMRDIGRLDSAPYFEPTLKTMTYDITTDSGYTVHVLRDKYGLNSLYGLGGWGFVFDMAHISGAHYKDLPFTWYQNIQSNRSIMLREDAYVGSFSLIMKHQSTHGVIRGGAGLIVER